MEELSVTFMRPSKGTAATLWAHVYQMIRQKLERTVASNSNISNFFTSSPFCSQLWNKNPAAVTPNVLLISGDGENAEDYGPPSHLLRGL